MKKSLSSLKTTVVALAFLAIMVLPVSGMVSIATQSPSPDTNGTAEVVAISAGTPSYYVTASVTNGTPVAGDPVTIYGTAAGDIRPTMVQIWVFAGNYVNVSNVPLDAAGGFSETYSTVALPPATYYVFVEAPGPNGDFNIDLPEAGIFSGQVVNTATNSLIFNLTGLGSLQNANASKALAEAFSDPEVDDVYTKLTFQLTAPSTEPTTAPPATPSSTPKTPVPVEITGCALVIGGLIVEMYRRKSE